ncbi:MAG: UDP-N-acetylmuramoyl-L-alanyl-D-glutamate--2,6-diaminopimelate ligase [Cytophagales bacterium]|nr:MAG: UDP-N-acetylmuramoyl-L-alanyl-D-glutamate--2,6-diaminopimelate ligase [Cytophagales bacterium]
MLLSELLESIAYDTTQNTTLSINQIQFDSRKIQANDLFVAIKGTQTDGHEHITKAIENGAVAIVCEQLPSTLVPHITYIKVADSATALGKIAAQYHQNPSEKLRIVAITGTNGKTTTATLCYRLFRQLGYQTGLLSTVENRVNDKVYPANLTTPDPLQMQALLAEMVKENCTHVFMEASSHAIVQQRMAGLKITGAVFTNITHDHLDFHGTFDNYIKAKKKLFDELPPKAFALVNIDDKRGTVMLQNCPAQRQYTFALKSDADFKTKIVENTLEGLFLEMNRKQIWCRLIGSFNAYNLTAILGIASLLGEDEDHILAELSNLEGANGRFEKIIAPNGVIGIVDYAHTPDALENVLRTLKDTCQEGQNIITVVGCGGNRDTTKRPIMAKIAAQFSHQVILTSDNPRFEDPHQILAEMEKGLSPIDKNKTKTIENRKEAIKQAYQMAKKQDVILIAGKGHETYQEIQGTKYPFDDKAVLQSFF